MVAMMERLKAQLDTNSTSTQRRHTSMKQVKNTADNRNTERASRELKLTEADQVQAATSGV